MPSVKPWMSHFHALFLLHMVYSKIPLLGPPSDVTQGGLNSKLVLIGSLGDCVRPTLFMYQSVHFTIENHAMPLFMLWKYFIL